jgi:hypothetical protein
MSGRQKYEAKVIDQGKRNFPKRRNERRRLE